MTNRVLTCVIPIVLGLACAPRLYLHTPARASATDRAVATVSGVHVTIDTDEWRGVPEALGDLVALQVTIENASSRPLRLRYREFALVSPSGERAPALPPFDLEQTVTYWLTSYPYPWYAFHLAPHLSGFYRGFWTGAWDFTHDADYYATHYRTLTGLVQPTPDMLRNALPEGVLEPGGRITGFLYFQDHGNSQRATFQANLLDAASRQTFGRIQVTMMVGAN
jgi:hypothetical protein